MTLVKNLVGEKISADLERAYLSLAKVYLTHRGQNKLEAADTDVCLLDEAICRTEAHIDLRSLRVQCELIGNDAERPVEVFNNLGHMFVLIQSIHILRQRFGYFPTFCSPTQQSDFEGNRIADLEGIGWAVEAYGGGDIKNNGKLAKDIRTLQDRALQGRRTFLAFRLSAFPAVDSWRPEMQYLIRHRCSAKHGGPITAKAQGLLIGSLNQVAVIEVCEIYTTEE